MFFFNKKYEMIKHSNGLYQVKALRDFETVKKGTLGGFIEKESNLSHGGNCWISENARVYGNARVYRNARVSGNALVFENARVGGNAQVCGYARVSGKMKVDGQNYHFIQASNHSITHSKGIVSIGCENHSLVHWLKHYKAIGKKYGYSNEQIKEYKEILDFLKKRK